MSRARRSLPVVLLLLLLLLGTVGSVVLLGAAEDDGGAGDGSSASVAGTSDDDAAAARERGRRERARVREGSAPESTAAGAAGGYGDGGDADGSGRGGDAETETSGAAAGGVGPGARADERDEVRGRVVDGATDVALANVRILVVRRDHGWNGTRTGDDGTFEGRVPEDREDGAPVELRIGKPGYRTVVVPWSGGPVEARLEALDRPLLPGYVEGTATDPEGHPLTGRVLLTTYDEMGDHHGLWALCDAGGAFRLEGLAPGWWTMRLVGGDATVDVIVPEGGSTRVHVVGGAEPWPGELTEVEFLKRRSDLSRAVPRGTTDDELSAEEREFARWRHVIAVQDLESRWRGARPAREVVVTGLPEAAVAHLRAATTSGPNHSWRARVEGGEARFPALTPELWRLVLEVPGAPAAAMDVEVVEGDGPLTVAWRRTE